MLHIVCPNTSIDVKIELNTFALGEVQRAVKNQGFAAGKGVNCAFACNYIDKAVVLHAMVGELDKDYFQKSVSTRMSTNLFSIPGETRRNLTIIDSNGLVAHIQTNGYSTPDDAVYNFIKTITDAVSFEDTVLISGSLPRGFSDDRLNELIIKLSDVGATVNVDTDLKRLRNDGSLSINCVKPNIEELSNYAKFHQLYDFKEIIETLQSLKVATIIISCGADGSYLFRGAHQPVLFSESSFDLQGMEAVGSGDAFIAVYTAMTSEGADESTALLHATSAGHSNVYHEGPGRIGKTYLEILHHVHIEEMTYEQVVNIMNNYLSK
ncbi:MAG: hypothetical protein KZQ98_02730 [Candidatus Thiodiazotropha sp. (ex Lucinoma borealis)]|nr:hypothetical protein [Candidatus Thiodiazotropha sp. (ex Lucinoma borealis)]